MSGIGSHIPVCGAQERVVSVGRPKALEVGEAVARATIVLMEALVVEQVKPPVISNYQAFIVTSKRSPGEFASYIKQESAKYKQLIEAANIKID